MVPPNNARTYKAAAFEICSQWMTGVVLSEGPRTWVGVGTCAAELEAATELAACTILSEAASPS